MLPRILFAEEKKSGCVRFSAVLATALKAKGYGLRQFVSSMDEKLMMTLMAFCFTPPVYLNLKHCGAEDALKTLFCAHGRDGQLNLIHGALGTVTDLNDDDCFNIETDTIDVAKALDCPVIILLREESSAALGIRKLDCIYKKYIAAGVNVAAVIFVGVSSQREYGLLDIELGRRYSLYDIGYLPKELDRKEASIFDLSAASIPMGVKVSMESCIAQLDGLSDNINWPLFAAIAKKTNDVQTRHALIEPILAGKKIGILRHPALSLGGIDTEVLLAHMGCNIVNIPIKDGTVTPDIDALYIPHGIGYMTLQQMIENKPLIRSLTEAFIRQKPLFAEGGAAPLIGSAFTSSTVADKVFKGMSLFAVKGSYEDLNNQTYEEVRVMKRTTAPTMLIDDHQHVQATKFSGIALGVDDEKSAAWRYTYKDVQCTDGWGSNKGVATALKMGFWSNPQILFKWAYGL